ncbi:uncharacterized protein LOC114304550 [Camellia sinensis]|uniref:uncharacterized protein LOC114304550 n=1 Tax=Camellia sinensis TaxID=4442 RepID=UPI0010355991|nr:uncharacterized protein LOC114304550 [Camellia sinensis]
MVDNGCLSSSLSVQKDIRCLSSKYSEKNPMGGTRCSLESSFTSSESSGQKEEKKSKHESGGDANSVVLSLRDMDPRPKEKGVPSNQISGRKKSESTISDGDWAEQPSGKHTHKTGDQLTRFGLMETFDLTDFDSGPKAIDLNCEGFEYCQKIRTCMTSDIKSQGGKLSAAKHPSTVQRMDTRCF